MNDMLTYMGMDSIYRKYHHDKLTFSLCYAFSENYVLPFSHDEVVHGKKSMLDKKPGDFWQQFAGLRALYGYTMAHPGKKLMFMGCEFGQYIEWKFDDPLDWFLLDYERHPEMQLLRRGRSTISTANTPALYEMDDSWDGFPWWRRTTGITASLVFMRTDREGNALVCVSNFTPVFPSLPTGSACRTAGTVTEVLQFRRPVITAARPVQSEARCMHRKPSARASLFGRGLRAASCRGIFSAMSATTSRRQRPEEARQESSPARGRVKTGETDAPEKTMCSHAAGRRTGQPAGRPDTSIRPNPPCPLAASTASSIFRCPTASTPASTPSVCSRSTSRSQLNSLHRLRRPWDLDRTNGGVFVLPPYVKGKDGEWYTGTANAIYQNIEFITQYQPRLCAHPFRRSHLQDGLRRDAAAPYGTQQRSRPSRCARCPGRKPAASAS